MSIREITPTELKQLLSDDNPPTLIDVREEGEAAICTIAGSTLIPMSELAQRIEEIPRDRPVAIYCHHGGRSMSAGQWLSHSGYDAMSLAGGIDLWAVEMDPGMNRY